MTRGIKDNDCMSFNSAPPEQQNSGPSMPIEEIAEHLWELLDRIDTASDMFKEDYRRLASYVYSVQQERFRYGSTDGYTVRFNTPEDPSPSSLMKGDG